MKKSVIIGLAVVLALWGGGASAQSILIPGTGACEAVLRELAVGFNARNSGIEVVVAPSTGSGGGIAAVLKGEAEVARVARPLKPPEIEQGLSYRAFARDAVVFAVGSKVSVRDFSRDQLVEIFAGNIRSWSALGAGQAPIRLLIREPQDSSLLVIREHIKPFESLAYHESAKLLYHDHEVVEMLKKHPTAIGWLTLSAVSAAAGDFHPAALDGVRPSTENILSGKYPLVTEYAFVFKEANLREQPRQFMEFAFSEPGRQILRNRGIVPVEKP